MGWADKKIKEYSLGQKATWLEKMMLEHANPVNLIASLLALAALIYGLWINNLSFVAVALVLGLIGHIYCWLQQ